MSQMFAGCVALNNLTLDFDTSNVIDMSYMFYKLGISQDNDVNIHIRSFDTKKVTSMYSMFGGISHIKVIDLPIDPQLMGALGAAEYARQKGMAEEN